MKKIKYNLFFILDFLYILVISLAFYFTTNIHSNRVIHIPSGSVNSIISYLSKTSYDVNIIDNITLRLLGSPQKGWIDLKETNMTRGDFIYKITTSKAAIKTIKLIPGETYYFLLKQLSKELNLSFEKLNKSYKKHSYKLDGNILAESYNIPLGMNEDRVIFFMIDYTNRKYKQYSNKIFGQYNKKKWFIYLTIASIIQKEAATIKEMPLISSVIHNRLKKNMRLQMDGTLNYGQYSHDNNLYKRIRNDKSSYNTYKNKGLPTNPICAVSFDAIKAAIKPAKTNYLYFVKSKNKNFHIFSTKYKKHKLNIKRNKSKKKTYKKKSTKQLEKKHVTKQPTNIKNLWKSVY